MEPHQDNRSQVAFINKIQVPEAARAPFLERAYTSRAFIRTLAGFIRDHTYERTIENGGSEFITMAIWANDDAFNNAREQVQAEYLRIGFDPVEMRQRLNIIADGGMFREDGVLP